MSSLKVKILDYKPHLVSIELPEHRQSMHIPRQVFEWRRDTGIYEVLNQDKLPKYL
ncbi:MAG: hypothetical protein AAGJ18_00965 [Bacteroidota bacterium]